MPDIIFPPLSLPVAIAHLSYRNLIDLDHDANNWSLYSATIRDFIYHKAPTEMATTTPKACRQCTLYCDSDSFCARLSNDELVGLNKKSHTASMKRGDSLSDEALMQWPIIAVSTGVLSLQHLLVDGRKSIAALYMRGDIIDLREISNRNRCNIISLSKSEICRLSPEAFEKIVSKNSDAQSCVWTNLREQTFRAIDHSVDLSKKQALEKVASFIIECNSREFNEPKSKVQASIPIRRVDLAEYIGVQPETVSRCFRDLQNRGIISFERLSELTVHKVDALRELASGDRHTD